MCIFSYFSRALIFLLHFFYQEKKWNVLLFPPRSVCPTETINLIENTLGATADEYNVIHYRSVPLTILMLGIKYNFFHYIGIKSIIFSIILEKIIEIAGF